MKRISTKLLSVFLCLVLLLNLLEPAAHAEGISGDASSSQELITEDPGESNLYDPEVEEILDDSDLVGSPEAIELDLENPYEGVFDQTTPEISDDTILSEETDRREETVKHVRLSDGSMAALQYNHPVFEKNIADEWVEIDNSLKSIKNSDGSGSYHVDRQDFSLDFLENPRADQLLKIIFPEVELGWSLMIPEGQISSVKSTYTPLPIENEDSLLYSKSVSGLLEYTNVLPDARLSYQLTGYTIKEDLILDSPEAIAENGGAFRFVLDPSAYTIRQTDEQNLEILDPEGKSLITISAPMMRDAAGQVSFSLQLTLEEPEENATRRTVLLTADEDWLTAEDRVYPVSIDPTIKMTYNNFTELDTVTVYSSLPNNHSQGYFAVGSSNAEGNFRTLVIPHTLPTLKSSDAVIAAAFTGTALEHHIYGASHNGPIYINLHAMNIDLALADITWTNTNAQDAYNTTIIDRQVVYETEAPSSHFPCLTWDITRMVKDWYINDSNHGFLLISENESDPASLRYEVFCSANSHAGMPDEARPAITVTYLNQEGLEPYLSTHGSGSATMGSLQVNDFNGNLVYTYTDISMDGAYMPITLAHVFNFSKRASSAVVGGGAYYGKGMRLNLSMKVAGSSVSGYPYCLTDADGTVHYFSLKSGTTGATGSVYEKEFESTTLLTKTSDGYKLDTGGTLLYYFNSSGYLSSIKDITNNKSQTLTYNSSGLLTQVKDGGDRIVTLSYNSSGYLTSVTDPAGRSTNYTYTDGQLTKITRPDGTHIDLEYSGTWLVKVKDIDGTSIGISYWSKSPYRVKRFQEYGADGSEGGRLTWVYSAGGTKVSDREGRSETMLFDNAGHTVCVRDGEGNAVFGKYTNTDNDKKNTLMYASGMQGSVTNYLKNHSFESSLTDIWKTYNSSAEGSIAQ
ncbi:MAG: RHS repeat protein, partial [Clostridia bacterium]|nr:RHS repeat protein [Clostridia bacterium]